MLYYFLFLLVISFIGWYFYTNFVVYQKKTNIPGPTFFESLFVLKPGQHKSIVEYATRHYISKDFIGMWLGPLYFVLALDPDATKFVLKEPKFRKIGLITVSRKQEDLFGENLVSVDGDNWRRQRGIINNGFSHQSLSNYYSTFLELTDKSIHTIPLGEDVELTDLFSRYTLDILGKTVFNHDFGRIGGQNDKYYTAYKNFFEVYRSAWARIMILFPWVIKLPFKPVQDYLQGMDTLVELFKNMINEHKGKSENSILSKLLLAADNPELLSEKELISNMWIFFLAGHETTSNALVHAFNCLRIYPEIQEKIYEEIIRVVGVDKQPTEEDLNNLVYMDSFIQEVLRLHSPIPALGTRQASEDVQYKDMIIPKGAVVGIHFHLVHTNPNYWDEPLKFDPERFNSENRKGRNHFMHVPFSAGLRQCIGNNFSMVEQRLFLTRLLQKYRVVNPKNIKPFPEDSFLLPTGNNVSVQFEKRSL